MWRLISLWRLVLMLRLLLAQEAFLPPDWRESFPLWLRLVRKCLIIGAKNYAADNRADNLARRISRLGVSYIKIGQFFATRPDIIGEALAADLAQLQDRVPPFPQAEAEAIIRASGADKYICEFSEAVAAASVAQVHKAQDKKDKKIKYAVKILRPDINKTLTREIDIFALLAKIAERLLPAARRLRPIAAIEILHATAAQETDLRREAAALSQMGEICAGNKGVNKKIKTPQVIWEASSREVLVMQWMDGTPIGNITALKNKGYDLAALSKNLIQIFLDHALNEGFFHADMHQGNLLVGEAGEIIALDFGITGRLDKKNRRALALILHGFITRDYDALARVHLRAGYIPPDTDPAAFAAALRQIGEPIRDRAAADISMAQLLAELFAITAQFNMATQPQLLLLQKTMVNVEGVARALNPNINFYDTAEPIIAKWLRESLGVSGLLHSLQNAAPHIIEDIIYLLENMPQLMEALRDWLDANNSEPHDK